MLVILVVLAFVAVIGVVNILAIVKGRAGRSRMGMAMLVCGLVGLLSLLVMIGSAWLVGVMLIAATFDSPQGYAFQLSAPICALATLASLALYAGHGRRQPHGA